MIKVHIASFARAEVMTVMTGQEEEEDAALCREQHAKVAPRLALTQVKGHSPGLTAPGEDHRHYAKGQLIGPRPREGRDISQEGRPEGSGGGQQRRSHMFTCSRTRAEQTASHRFHQWSGTHVIEKASARQVNSRLVRSHSNVFRLASLSRHDYRRASVRRPTYTKADQT